MQKNIEEEDISKARVQPSTKVEPNVMKINMSALGATKAKRCATIMDITIFLDRGICIMDLDQFMWI
jgi:hypothetical protein